MSLSIDFENRDQFDFKSELDWLSDIQQSAFSGFQGKALPSRKVEHWKYNDMAFLKSARLNLITEAGAVDSVKANNQKITLDDPIELHFVDGLLVTELSSLQLPEGLTLTLFSDANSEQQAFIKSQFEENNDAKNLLVSLNEALIRDGLLIEVNKNTQIKQPIYVRHQTSNSLNDALSVNKILMKVNKSAEASLIEHFLSLDNDRLQLSLQETSFIVGENAQLEHYRLNLESEHDRQASKTRTILGKDSRLKSFYLGLGSRLNRTDIDVIHAGQNAECHITGIYLPANQQAIDYHTNIEHRVPHCNSTEVFRGIIADSASATFNGKIHIFQDAQKSDAQLNNKNLLLTNQAEVNTKPELEIYADDVSCAHGATVAQLDHKSLYYLQTRGIDKQQAKKMLSIAFVQELINQIQRQPIREYLSQLLDGYMAKIS